ncbi:hypothetical protein ACKVMT_12705 [Halobacteriales archaeon Cl-PHB]
MSEISDRPFSRFYAQLVREAGEDDPADGEERDRLGVPKVANPRRDAES